MVVGCWLFVVGCLLLPPFEGGGWGGYLLFVVGSSPIGGFRGNLP